ncbi:helix-turn-helix domain-containing protein [Bacillus sp. 105MF]|uniref:helix-turn-helix domain-containing protein n=1 Tax=Bacillus sp. 105MF TaxID=1151120 RepID=UPI00036536E3|nr:helix-turn-helix transcriptional regulator [Bacillus sp. 105MF]
MSIGKEIASARKRKGYTQEELSSSIPASRESLAKYETENRILPKDMQKHLSEALDDPQFFFQVWGEAAGTVSIPYLDGEYIDQHPTSMKYMVQKETAEALEQLETVCWFKPPQALSDLEKQEMNKVMHEILDAAASMTNLVAVLCERHDFSMKEVFKYWRLSLRARRYTEN